MQILAVGGLGFIGSHLVERLQNDHEVSVLDNRRHRGQNYFHADLNDYYSLEKVFDLTKPELVIHLAAMVSRKECEETPSLAITTNVVGTHNICTLSLRHKSRVIYAGSSEEYGTAYRNGIVNEDTVFGVPTGIYSMTKRMAEEIVQYMSSRQLIATTIRFFMLYGPREEPTDYRSAVIRFTHWALTGEPLQVHKGTERSWCYIEDAIDAIERIVNRQQESNYEVYNIGKDDPITTEDLARKIVGICGSKSEIKEVPPDPTIIPIKRGSFEKAKRVLGWEAKVPLDQGLEKVRDYLLNREV
jgi:nucleoside-diphosphate-sugar epimerase